MKSSATRKLIKRIEEMHQLLSELPQKFIRYGGEGEKLCEMYGLNPDQPLDILFGTEIESLLWADGYIVRTDRPNRLREQALTNCIKKEKSSILYRPQ